MAYWTLLFFIVGGVFRRILGQSIYIGKFKLSRIWKLLLLILMALYMYEIKGVFPTDLKSWLMMAWAIGWLVRYNSHTHGDYFHLWSTSKDEGRCKGVDAILRFCFGKDGYYNFWGNFVGLTLGYLVPATLASLTMSYHWFWIAGFTTPVCYALCEGILEKEIDTESAEVCFGAIMLALFFLCV